jgi:hypothetical protein
MAGRKAWRVQKCARVLVPNVLRVSGPIATSASTERSAPPRRDGDALFDVLLSQVQQQLALHHARVVDPDRRVADLGIRREL